MKKRLVKDTIFEKHYEGSPVPIPLGDLPKDLLPTDEILINYDEGFQSENDSWDPSTTIIIIRYREETDAEFEERKAWWEEKKEESRKKRYEDYLKLMKEFEEGLLTKHGYRMSEEEKKNFDHYSEMKFNNISDDR